MWPQPVKAVVFDMDGLLVDTERRLFRIMAAVAPDFGVEVDAALFHGLIGLPFAESSARLRAHFGSEFPLDDYVRAVGVRGKHLDEAGVALKSGVIELLDHLDALGLPRAIATSSAHETVQRNLGHHGLESRFHAVIARGDYARGKPAPDPFLAAAKALNTTPGACLALEDSHNGVRAARAAGMMTVMVPDMLHADEEMRELALHIVETLHDVRVMLR